jgi:hypothetical protein
MQIVDLHASNFEFEKLIFCLSCFVISFSLKKINSSFFRAAEEKLGIAAGEGMAIKYERNTENIAGIFGIILVVGLLALLFAGGRNLRSR